MLTRVVSETQIGRSREGMDAQKEGRNFAKPYIFRPKLKQKHMFGTPKTKKERDPILNCFQESGTDDL